MVFSSDMAENDVRNDKERTAEIVVAIANTRQEHPNDVGYPKEQHHLEDASVGP